MTETAPFKEKILSDDAGFEAVALEIFRYQAACNPVYQKFLHLLKIAPGAVKDISQIPFMPVSTFKTHEVLCNGVVAEEVFTSSGTTGRETSRHYVAALSFYKKVFMKAFQHFYGDIKNYCVLCLLPSYLERPGSSLVYMCKELIRESGHGESGFFLHEYEKLAKLLVQLQNKKQQVLLLGVSFALLDFAEQFPMDLSGVTIMETGGMKGRRKEMIREDLHGILKDNFRVGAIHSEYGMTELLSQAYSKGNGIFQCPPWMRIVIRDVHDPLGQNLVSKTGAVNIIDLANVDSCAFISTHDLGKVYADGRFEILGRFDNSDLRGCNLMVA